MRQGRRHVGLLAAAFALVIAPPAFAGTAYVENGTLHYRGGSVDVMAMDEGFALVEDATAGPGCVQDREDARCTGVDHAVIDLDDQGATVRVGLFSTRPIEVVGGAGNDRVSLDGKSALRFEGGPGQDALEFGPSSGTAADTFKGGPGRDQVHYWYRKTPLNVSLDDVANDGAAGEHDNIGSDVEWIDGGDADDTLTGGPGDDTLYGNGGSDTLSGLGGDDFLYPSGGSLGGCGDEHLDGGADDDRLVLTGGVNAIGGSGDDAFLPLESCAGPNAAAGGSGTDTADFSAFSSGHGLWVSLDDVADDGKSEADNYHSDIENATANPNGMVLVGNDGANVLRGGHGDDVLDGAGGADVLIGGLGLDAADYSLREAAVSLTADGQANDGEAGEQDAIADDVEDLFGGDGDDMLAGGGADNLLDGGPGADTMRGGGGDDAVDYSWREAPVRADLDGQAGDDGESGEGDTIGADVEGLLGGEGADVLTGNALSGLLLGGGGGDALTDAGGDDLLDGGEGDDVLTDAGGDDLLDGGEGDDRLADAGGEDLLDGGSGDDALESADGVSDLVACGDGTDAAHRDDIDALEPGCETVTTVITRVATPTPTPTATPTPIPTRTPRPTVRRPPPVSRPAADRTAPKAVLRVARQRSTRVRASGLAFTVACDEPCAVRARLRASSATAKSLRRRGLRSRLDLGNASAGRAPGERSLRVKLSATGRRALRRLRAGTYVLTVTVEDAAGNRRRMTHTLRLRP